MSACAGSTHSVSPARSRSALISVFVRLYLLSLCALLVQGPRPASCVPVSEFFPFGTSVNDSMTVRDDDGGSGKINLTVMFPFFGNRHDKLYVNNNGVISFFKELRDYRPENFPLEEETPIIAPYWADVDISKNSNGTVWYRETREPSLLAKASDEIRAFGAYRNFRAYWVFVATWDEVGFYGADEEGLNKKNTFQAVLVLDTTGRQSFVILNYAKIEWTTGSNSQGNSSTGLGGSPAQAGFNAGDRENYFEIEGARTTAIINLTQTSNMGVPGKWIFRIDSAAIVDVCSQRDTSSISFEPMYASMLGGQAVKVRGLCSQSPLNGVTGHLPEYGMDLCCFSSSNGEDDDVYCSLPPIFQTGLVNISISMDNGQGNYTGTLDIKNIMDVGTDIKRHKPEEWITGSRVTISWKPKIPFIDDEEHGYKIEILEFRMLDEEPLLYSVTSTYVGKSANRKYEIYLPSLSGSGDSFSGASVAVVKVTPQTSRCSNISTDAGPAIYSDVFPIRYDNPSTSENVCSDWLSAQSKLPPLNDEGHCPCILRQAEGDTARYTTDPFCHKNSDWSSNCMYRAQYAGECIMPNQLSASTSTYVCCYDKDTHELLHADNGGGGGTRERYNFRQGPTEEDPSIVPYFTYMREEIVPFLHCCEYSSNTSLCQQYLKIREPVGCQGYVPPAAAQASGDPHIETLDHYAYTFNGKGEFILLRVKDTEAQVQVRATLVRDAENKVQNATVFTGIAVLASNTSSKLEIGLGSESGGSQVFVFVDSEEYTLSTSPTSLREMTVYNRTVNGTTELTVVMEDVGLSVLIEITDELLNIMVIAGAQLKGHLEGLLGNYNDDKSDDLTARDGTTLSTTSSMRAIHYDFGMTWSVPKNDSLFKRTGAEGFDISLPSGEVEASYNTPIFSDEVDTQNLRNNTSEICGDNLQCKFDYAVTGKVSIAESTKKFSERYEETKEGVSRVVRCPYLSADAIPNGNRNLTGTKIGDMIYIQCYSDFVINGSAELHCTEEGFWNDPPPVCVEKVNTDSTFSEIYIFIAVGGAAGFFLVVVVVVLVGRLIYKRQSQRKIIKKLDKENGSDFEQAWEMPTIFPPSDIPSPVFENPLFMSSLSKLSEHGSFHIPRPTFVDPKIYSEYF